MRKACARASFRIREFQTTGGLKVATRFSSNEFRNVPRIQSKRICFPAILRRYISLQDTEYPLQNSSRKCVATSNQPNIIRVLWRGNVIVVGNATRTTLREVGCVTQSREATWRKIYSSAENEMLNEPGENNAR